MNETSIYIRDHESLIELNNVLEYSADSLLKILESVNKYLNGVKEAFNQQKELLEDALRIAEEELEIAEEELSCCEESQEWDEESKEYHPSCSYESEKVVDARKTKDAIRTKYDNALKIISDFDYEVYEYKKSASIGTYAGAERNLEDLCKEHTDNATEKLRDILEVVNEYLSFRISSKSSNLSASDSNNSQINEKDIPLTHEQKKERFKNAIQRVIERQQKEFPEKSHIANANHAMCCHNCGRPLVACVCSNTREREFTREKIQILKNEYSR